MPIAAVVDSKIFCVHGGIPPPWMAGGGYISHLDRVANSIRDPEENEPLVWEYLWNDPLQHNMALPPDVEVDRTGFVHNFRFLYLLLYNVLTCIRLRNFLITCDLHISNRIYLVLFMCLTVDTSFIFTRKNKRCKIFF